MKRIGVVGTCQASGVGNALFHLFDPVELSVFEVVEIERLNTQSHAEAVLAGCDVVFTHYLPDRFGAFATDNLRGKVKELVTIPSLVFTGFHPDCIYLKRGETCYRSPLDSYHSAIVAASYSLGLPAERALRLFNKFVFQKLGYFDEFAKARAFMDQLMTAHGFDLAGEWSDWMRFGPFMHTLNHPKPHVLASVTKLAAIKAGLVPAGTPTPAMPGDPLTYFSIWPVYPEIAEALGLTGSYAFKKTGLQDLAGGGHNLLSLKDFIAGSYEAYAEVPAEAFEIEDVARVRKILSTLLT